MPAFSDEGSFNNLLRIRQVLDTVLAGSGISVNANFNVGDVVGITNAAGDPIDPARLQDITNLRLDTARITQPSGIQTAANSQSVTLASNHVIIPVSVTVSGQQTQANSVSMTLSSNERIIPVSATVSGQQTAANSLSFTLASNERVLPVSATVSGQQTAANSLSVTLATNERVLPVSATTSGQQIAANSLSVTLASNERVLPVSATVSGQQTKANSLSVTFASDQNHLPVSVASSGIPTVGDIPYTQAMTSGIQSVVYRTVSDSNTRATALTATAGKRLQVYEVQAANYSNTVVHFEVYYGTGNDITVNPSGALLNTPVSNALVFAGKQWVNGSVQSSVGDVLSVRTSGLFATPANITTSGVVIVHYREV